MPRLRSCSMIATFCCRLRKRYVNRLSRTFAWRHDPVSDQGAQNDLFALSTHLSRLQLYCRTSSASSRPHLSYWREKVKVGKLFRCCSLSPHALVSRILFSYYVEPKISRDLLRSQDRMGDCCGVFYGCSGNLLGAVSLSLSLPRSLVC